MPPILSSFLNALRCGVLLLSLSHASPSYSASPLLNESNRVLILYDATSSKPWVGYLNALLLANLIGHFDKTYRLLPVEHYNAGVLEQYSTTFYLGGTYNNPLPQAFISDVFQTTQTVVWFRYNLWMLLDAKAKKQFGFQFDYMDGSGYDQILYKHTELTKNKRDNELGHVTILDQSLANAPALALQTSTGSTIPYAVHGAHLWYIADIPFTFISENDRYLAFADLLHDIFKINHPDQKRALIRLEDIDPTYNPDTLIKIADYLYSQHVPFGIAVIPYYQDPLGYYRNGVSKAVKMTDAPDFVNVLKYMESKGGSIILHGYTHQYGCVENAYTGISGHDYEFFKVAVDPLTLKINTFTTLDEDSYDWVNNRVMSALSLLSQSGLTTSIWETPHYVASDLDNRYFAEKFPAIIGRVLYFNTDDPTHYAGQFFPYVIQKDSYGQKILPENIGCISPVTWFNFPVRTVDDLLLSARKNRVIRDAWASMYYHPYLGLNYLQQLIPEIKKLGYTFVSVSSDLK